MRPNSLRLASPGRAEQGKASGQPTEPGADPPSEHENPAPVPGVTEEHSETPTPKQSTAEVTGETHAPGEYTCD
jgi:hypothetical protein